VKSAIRTALTKRLANVQKRIPIVEQALEDASEPAIASFELDTGEADQKVTFKSVEKLQKNLDNLYAQEEQLLRRLGGCGFVSVRVRRKP
jgi:hypothetical protein